jgi:hypothetical protein
MSDTLANHLFHNPTKITYDYVLQLVEEGTRKCDFIIFIIDFFSKFALTNNVWLLSKIKEYCNLIESTKRCEFNLLVTYCFEIICLFKHIPKKKYIFRCETDKKQITDAEIDYVTQNVNISTIEEELASLSSIVQKDIHGKLLILFSCITHTNNLSNEENVRICFLLVRYLLSLQPKSYLLTKESKLDIVDILFLVLVLFSKSSHCKDVLKRYIQIAKDIFYYKVNKQKKIERINIVFYVIYAIIFETITDVVVDIDKCNIANEVDDNALQKKQKNDNTQQVGANAKLEPSEKCGYLFVYSEYDESLALQIKFERERNKLQRTYKPTLRSINVAWNINNEKDYITVLKQGKD